MAVILQGKDQMKKFIADLVVTSAICVGVLAGVTAGNFVLGVCILSLAGIGTVLHDLLFDRKFGLTKVLITFGSAVSLLVVIAYGAPALLTSWATTEPDPYATIGAFGFIFLLIYGVFRVVTGLRWPR